MECRHGGCLSCHVTWPVLTDSGLGDGPELPATHHTLWSALHLTRAPRNTMENIPAVDLGLHLQHADMRSPSSQHTACRSWPCIPGLRASRAEPMGRQVYQQGSDPPRDFLFRLLCGVRVCRPHASADGEVQLLGGVFAGNFVLAPACVRTVNARLPVFVSTLVRE